jgi:hypothetical protein
MSRPLGRRGGVRPGRCSHEPKDWVRQLVKVPERRTYILVGGLVNTGGMPDWSLLVERLGRVETSLRLTWAELDAIVGGLPPSAARHRAWWSGNRAHVRAWRSAGFGMTDLIMGREVTFVRTEGVEPRAGTASWVERRKRMEAASIAPVRAAARADLLLVTCVKTKLDLPAPAKDLYVSPLFKRESAYAERQGIPWFILSAEHGLVTPDEWLAPYERYLPDTPADYRAAWGARVAERLETLVGAFADKVIEVHASASYMDAITPRLAAKGATVLNPLEGLAMGERLRWYDVDAADSAVSSGGTIDPDGAHAAAWSFVAMLLQESRAIAPSAFLDGQGNGLKVPGLYSWWVDDAGAQDLAKGLGLSVSPGLIYAGLAGATRWPSGKRSKNNLWSRIAGMHLGGRHQFSTFRLTLGAILANVNKTSSIDEAALTEWMKAHLKVLAIPYDDAHTLGKLEDDVLKEIDPPLNLQGMAASPVRLRLKELRRQLG